MKDRLRGSVRAGGVAFQNVVTLQTFLLVLAENVNWAATSGEMTHKEPNALRKAKTLLVTSLFTWFRDLNSRK